MGCAFAIQTFLGDKYGNSVQYQTFGRIDDSADEWIDDDLLRKVSIGLRLFHLPFETEVFLYGEEVHNFYKTFMSERVRPWIELLVTI